MCQKRGGMSSDMGAASNLFPPINPVPPRRQKMPCQTSGGKTLSASLHKSSLGPGTLRTGVRQCFSGRWVSMEGLLDDQRVWSSLFQPNFLVSNLTQTHPLSALRSCISFFGQMMCTPKRIEHTMFSTNPDEHDTCRSQNHPKSVSKKWISNELLLAVS